MEDQDVGALLVQDIEAHMTYLQLGGFAVTIVLALIGVILSMRAYAVLSEARALYWQASALSASAATTDAARAARAAAIRAAQSKKKIRSNRIRGIV
jgi:hypothetical protein